MLKVLRDTLACLTVQERWQSLLVLGALVLMALFEVIGLAAIMPFLAVLADPEAVTRQPVLGWLYQAGGFTSRQAFISVLGIAAFVLFFAAACVRSLALWAQNQFLQLRRHTLSARMLAGYLRQPYEFFLGRHSSDLAKNILSEVDTFMDRALLPIGTGIAQALVLLAMVALLLFVDFRVALSATGMLALAYVLIFAGLKRILQRAGHERAEANRLRYRTAAEALGAIKALKLAGREDTYVERYTAGSRIYAERQALHAILTQLPKYIVETLAFGGIIVIVLITLAGQGDDAGIERILPLVGLYAMVGYRALPAIQNVYASFSSLSFARGAVDTIRPELRQIARGADPVVAARPLPLTRQLELRDVTYRYPGSTAGLQDISFTLRKGESLGIVGHTGAGKSTLADIVLGLLVPQSGEISVDGRPLDAALRQAWQRGLGYVPQDLFMIDASVAENIAFGLPRAEIDLARVEQVARIAQIHEFVIAAMPQGYATRIGEHGVRLSGGQRQRLGIARALYQDPELIVFDEATSALDTATEAEVMAALASLSGIKTVIVITHRTATLANCTRIMHIAQGRLHSDAAVGC